jgi:hypothetical protein
MDNPKCYAGALNDCCQQMTGEHVMSASVLRVISDGDSTVTITNLTFLTPGSPKKLPISALVANILCETHNCALSPYDTAMKELVASLDRIDKKMTSRIHMDEEFVVNGDGIERWFLKTLIDGVFSGQFPLSDNVAPFKGTRPHSDLLNILYRGAQFPRNWGLYLHKSQGEDIVSADQSIPVMVEANATGIGGLHAWPFGFRFTLALWDGKRQLPEFLENAIYRPYSFTLKTWRGFENRIKFNWSNGGSENYTVHHYNHFVS